MAASRQPRRPCVFDFFSPDSVVKLQYRNAHYAISSLSRSGAANLPMEGISGLPAPYSEDPWIGYKSLTMHELLTVRTARSKTCLHHR
jgi:hypothetical protein